MHPVPEGERMSEPGQIWRRLLAAIKALATGDRVRRLVFMALRRFAPVLRVGDTVIVTRLDDVQEVFSHHEQFSVRRFGVRMREAASDFLLGHDDDEQYRRDKRAASETMAKLDQFVPLGVFALARRCAEDVIRSRVIAGDHLDVVKDLADEVPVRVIEEYFGVPNPGGRTLLEWVQNMSWYIFNPFASADDRERGVLAGVQLREHVDRLIEQAASPHAGARARNLLQDFVQSGACQDAVARTICGLVAGTLGPPPRQFARAIDQLLDLGSDPFQCLQAQARAGNAIDVAQYVREASRFAPEPSIIYRTCEQEYRLNGTSISAGRTVLCMIESALMDGRPGQVLRPTEFHPGRDRGQQMIFGYGLHACMGEGIGLQLLAGMALPLLALPGLRRAHGRAGRLRFGEVGRYPEENYPQHLLVCYESAKDLASSSARTA
jgi:cytochrome P450